MRPVPPAVLPLIHQFEQGPHGGFSATTYIDPVGVPTIGYGHALAPGDPLIGATIDANDADTIAMDDLGLAAQGICDTLGVAAVTALSDNQYAALIDFTFNVGVGHFAASTLCHLIKGGNLDAAAYQFGKWIYGRVGGIETVLPGLVTRRNAEKALWQTP